MSRLTCAYCQFPVDLKAEPPPCTGCGRTQPRPRKETHREH